MQVSFKVLKRHFDKGIVTRSWKTVNKRPLQHAGLLVRKIMRGSIRRVTNDKPSKVGKPPHAHKPKEYRGKADFKRIFSVPAPWKTAEIIGHEGLGQKQTPMEIQEFGQRVQIKTYQAGRQKARTRKQADAARKLFLAGRIKSKPAIVKTIKMPERKFAYPALEKAKLKLPQFWKDSITVSTVRNTV